MPTLRDLPIPLDFAPMEAKLVDELPSEPGWRFEPKWDGFRCLAFRAGDEVELKAKSGKPLGRFFPDVVEALKALPVKRFVIDGELTISVGGELSFGALQMRLHPAASRVRKLAAETPATLVLFDNLMDAKTMPPEKQAKTFANARRYLDALEPGSAESKRCWKMASGCRWERSD